MRIRKQDKNGDMTFGNGLLDFYINTPEAVVLSVQTRLLLWVNEWFLNIEDGTPWLQGVLGKQRLSTVENVIRSRILETEGVTGITEFNLTNDPNSRKLSITASIDTIYGEAELEQVIS